MRLDKVFTQSLLLVALLALPQSTRAAEPLIVGGGTAESCTETALQEAVAVAAGSGGGTIKFQCGEGPVTIALAAPLVLPHNMTIDGDGVITLSRTGFEVEDLILVEPNSTVVVKNITFNRAGGRLGYALINGGTLTIKDSTFSDNHVTAINDGILTVVRCTFSGNGNFTTAGTIWNRGMLTVKDSLFSGNKTVAGGGVYNQGTLEVEGSTFDSNKGDGGFGAGGAIHNAGTATIKSSSFVRNNAARGGSISNSGTLAVTKSVFDGAGGAEPSNIRNAIAGGGIYNSGEASVSNSQFVGNVATMWGGAVYNLGALRISKSSITGNTALVDGGGIYTCNGGSGFLCFGSVGTLELSKTDVTGNTPNDIVP